MHVSAFQFVVHFSKGHRFEITKICGNHCICTPSFSQTLVQVSTHFLAKTPEHKEGERSENIPGAGNVNSLYKY